MKSWDLSICFVHSSCKLPLSAVMKNEIILENSTVRLREDGIMHVHMRPGWQLELSDAVEIVEAEGKLGGGGKFPTLHTMDKYITLGEGVREFSAAEGTKYTSAEAYVIKSLSQRILGNFYLKVDKPSVPTRLFTDVDNAIEWLKTFQ